jgi:ssRNA-specific RNase YbeY (16S rRNA maturation enzyme)
MLARLTPEQAYELQLYHAMEPFGEVRDDMRMANVLRFYYDAKRGKKGDPLTLGELMLYRDFAEAAAEQRGDRDLQKFLGKVANSG